VLLFLLVFDLAQARHGRMHAFAREGKSCSQSIRLRLACLFSTCHSQSITLSNTTVLHRFQINQLLNLFSVKIFGSASVQTSGWMSGRTPARHTTFRAPCGARATRATREEGRVAPLIRKDLAAVSYGMPCQRRERRCSRRWGEEMQHPIYF
jgi:hypothetical protein